MNPAFDDGSDKITAFTYDLEKATAILSEGEYIMKHAPDSYQHSWSSFGTGREGGDSMPELKNISVNIGGV